MTAAAGRRFHLAMLGVWTVGGIPVSVLLRHSLPWLVFLVLYAIIALHWTGWNAARPGELERGV